MRCARCFTRFDKDDPAVANVDPDETILCGECEEDRDAPATPLNIEAFFGNAGPLAKANPNYEARPGQVRLARAIHDAAVGQHHLLAEGPCGIGKSMAYGVTAAHLAAQRKRVMIVTASIALQEQLVNKDLPALAKVMPEPFTFALFKGRSNYVCLEQRATADASGLMYTEKNEFDAVARWSRETKTGDRSELTFKPAEKIWNRFVVGADACPGSKCASHEECFATKARGAASRSGVIVTNYHLFFLNIATGGKILPMADVVILDEGHEAADIARDVLGFRVGEGSFKRLARDASKRGAPDLGYELGNAARDFFQKLLRFYDCPHYDKKIIRSPLPFGCEELEKWVGAYTTTFPRSHLVGAAERGINTIRKALTVADSNCVYLIDAPDKTHIYRDAALVARYLSPAATLENELWPAFQSVIVVSATLTTDGKFDFARAELGAPKEAKELVVESPFNFGRQALLVVPPPAELPEPNDPNFPAVVAAKLVETIEACGGRTLGLFTSYRALNLAHKAARERFGTKYVILKQGDLPPAELTRQFKENVRSVLLATTSFWTGIDVPGEALTGLVIERLPFGNPDDPVALKLAEKDRGAFAHHVIPKSILTLRQGFGRLIRSMSDVGVVVMLDKRISTKPYGRRFMKSLPVCSTASSTAAIAPFLRNRGVAA